MLLDITNIKLIFYFSLIMDSFSATPIDVKQN